MTENNRPHVRHVLAEDEHYLRFEQVAKLTEMLLEQNDLMLNVSRIKNLALVKSSGPIVVEASLRAIALRSALQALGQQIRDPHDPLSWCEQPSFDRFWSALNADLHACGMGPVSYEDAQYLCTMAEYNVIRAIKLHISMQTSLEDGARERITTRRTVLEQMLAELSQ